MADSNNWHIDSILTKSSDAYFVEGPYLRLKQAESEKKPPGALKDEVASGGTAANRPKQEVRSATRKNPVLGPAQSFPFGVRGLGAPFSQLSNSISSKVVQQTAK